MSNYPDDINQYSNDPSSPLCDEPVRLCEECAADLNDDEEELCEECEDKL